MTDMGNAADLHAWFEVDFDDTTDGVEEESQLVGAPAVLLRRLRDLVPTLREVGFGPGDTSAWYEDGRLTVILQIEDRQGRMVLRCLRLEIGDTDWVAAWVSPARYDQPEFEQADPEERVDRRIDDPEQGAREAVDWIAEQVRRPINRYVWRDGGDVRRLWRLEDTGRNLVGWGPPPGQDVSSAHETVQVRP